jgi:hypothetical protein
MSQPEMLADRLRAELAEVKRQRDLLREACKSVARVFEGYDDAPIYARKCIVALKATEAP